MSPMAKYANNIFLTTVTGMSSLFANLGFNPHTNWLVEVDAKNATSRNYIH
jgi:hypothetical protein